MGAKAWSSLALLVILVSIQSPRIMLSPTPVLPKIASQLSDPGVHRTYWLTGGAASNWNNSFGNPGPWVNASDGDTVSIIFTTGDTGKHNWYLDFNNNFAVDSSERPTESPDFDTTTNSVGGLNFTFTTTLSTIPHGGTFTYRCLYHPPMYGNFRFNARPVASFTHSPATPIRGQPASFNASSSFFSTNASSITSYQWDLGDGNKTSSGSVPTITHRYATIGTFTVSLNITDNVFQNAQDTQSVTVVNDFDYQVTVSPQNSTIFAGQSTAVFVILRSLFGTQQDVMLSSIASPSDSIVHLSFNNGSGIPSYQTWLGIATSPTSYCIPGPCLLSKTYEITIMAVSGAGVNHNATFTLTLRPTPIRDGGNYFPFIIAGIIGGIVVLAVLVFFRRNRRRKLFDPKLPSPTSPA